MRKLILLPILTFLLTFSAFSQDLIIESLERNDSYYANEGLSFSITFKNIGVIASIRGDNYGFIYLSKDATVFSDHITYFSIPALEPNESITITQNYGDDNFINVIDRDPGEYYIFAEIRNYNNSDVNLGNNERIGDNVDVLPPTTDLSITLISSLNASYNQNDLISTTLTATNTGSPVYNCNIDVYLSTDQVLDSEDYQLMTRESGLDFNYEHEVTSDLIHAIPNNSLVGEYYVIYEIDHFEDYFEVNETNNTIVSDIIEIKESDVQLEITSASVTVDYEDIIIDFIIKNNGTSTAKNYNYDIYWSSDGQTLDYMMYSGVPNLNNEIESNNTESFNEFLYDDREFLPEQLDYIVITNTDPRYPEIEPYSFYAPPPPPPADYNFNISDVYLSSLVETEDSEIPITLEIENPNNNSIYESATIDITLESLDGQIVEDYSISEYVNMYDYGTDELNLSLPNRTSLIAGTYTVTTDISLDYESGSAGPFTSEIEIIASEYNIEVEVLGQNGDIINQGIVYFYEKAADGTINFLSSKNIEENNGVGTVSFQQSAGNYMFFVVPDKDEFPNYIRTVSGNTFKLEETSFTEINSDATIQIETIYVDPNALSGSKIIEGNVVGGTATGRMTYSQAASASFDQTPVYLIQDNAVVAFTYTDASGAFTFSNVENGDYEVYFDDGEILESNDITANVNIDESTDIVNLTIDESGEVGIEDLKMEINAFFIRTKDVEADEDQVLVEYGLSNSYFHNNIDIQDAFFYCYIKQNDVVIDSIAFEKDLVILQFDSLQFQSSLQLTNPLNIGEYEVELHFTTPYQNTEVRGLSRTFNVIEPHYDVTVTAFDSQQSALSSGLVQFYKVDESGQLVLFEEKAVSQDGVASFNTPTCDYIISVVPDQESFPNILPSFQNQKYYFSEENIQTLTADTEHQINLVSNPAQDLNGNRKVVFDIKDDNFDFDKTQVVLANPADSSVISTATMEENHVEIENFETGEYLFFFDDENVTMNHEKWYSLVINEQDDLYQIEVSSSNSSLNQYDFDFVVTKDSVFNSYNNVSQLDMTFDIDKQSGSFPDDLLSVDFRIDLIANERSDSLSFVYSEMLDFNTFEKLEKAFLLDSFLDAGTYELKVNYASEYTDGFVEGGMFLIDILDAGVNLTKVELEQELLENALQIPLQLQLNGSTDSLTDFKVYYEQKLIKGTDTITIQDHQNSIEIGNEESKTYSYSLNLENPLAFGDYRLITSFSPHRKDKTNQQLVETTFRVKNERISLSNLKLTEELSIISRSMDFGFNISANSEDSIENQSTELFSYLIYQNDTLLHTKESLNLNIPKSSTTAFESSFDFNDDLGSGLDPGDYKFVIELKHPEDIYSEKEVVTFRVRDLSIELLEVVIPEEIAAKTDEVNCQIEVSGNSNDIVRSLETSFKMAIISKEKIIADTVITKVLTIQRSGSINLEIPLSFLTELKDGDYVLELSYITKYMSNYSATISKEFTVFTESEITSNHDKLISEYSIFPNPFVDHFQIDGDDFDNALLYDQYGKLIKTYNEEKGFQNLGDLNAGVYLIVIEYKGNVIHKKLVKK